MSAVRYFDIVTKLRRARIAKDMKRADLARILGCDQSTVHRYETKATMPTGMVLIAWADALDVDLGRSEVRAA